MIDLRKAKQQFTSYVKAFDTKDERVILKIVHSQKVSEIAKDFAVHRGCSQEDSELAELIGLLHDIGRFEQLKRYHTFLDAQSIDHAELGVQILQGQNLLPLFYDDRTLDSLVLKAISNHNKYQPAQGLNKREYMHTAIIRDADKTDIFRVNLTEKEESVYQCSKEQLLRETVTQEVLQDFMNCRSIASAKRKTHVDILLSHMAFIFDYNDEYALSVIAKQHYIEQMVDRYCFHELKTQQMMQQAKHHALQYMENKLRQMR